MSIKHAFKWMAVGLTAVALAWPASAAVEVGDLAICNRPVEAGTSALELGPDELVGGYIKIAGTAGADAGLDKVEVSLDNGQSWKPAAGTLMWHYRFRPEEGQRYELLVRALDANGATSPVSMAERITISYRRTRLRDRVREKLMSLVQSYTTENRAAFMDHFDADEYRDRRGDVNDLEDRVLADFDLYTNMRVRVTVERVLQRGSLVEVQIFWNFVSDQHQNAGLAPLTGRETLLFAKTSAMKLIEIRPAGGRTSLFGFTNPDEPDVVTVPGEAEGGMAPQGFTLLFGQGFDFATGAVAVPGDIFIGSLRPEGGVTLAQLGPLEWEDVRHIPPGTVFLGGAIHNLDVLAAVGEMIAVKLADNTYALMKLQSWTEVGGVWRLTFQYMYPVLLGN